MPRAKKEKYTVEGTPSAPRAYSFSDVLACTTATKSELVHWTNKGIITADIENTAGTGFHRRFSFLNVIEIELAAALNRFKVPVRLIGVGVSELRRFHHRNSSLSAAGPTAGSERFTRAQREAFFTAIVAETRRIGPGPNAKGLKNVAAAVDDERVQQNALIEAAGWERYRHDRSFRLEKFCGLFVFPPMTSGSGVSVGDYTSVAHDFRGDFSMTYVVPYAAVVVNLAPILDGPMHRAGDQL